MENQTTASLRCQLFGPLALFSGNEPLPLPVGETARSLLAYLLLHGGQESPRALLAGLFWPDMEEGRARRQLSQALWKIRTVLPGLIQGTASDVSLSSQLSVSVDVEQFRSLLDRRAASAEEGRSVPRPGLGGGPGTESERLRQAVALYGGDLLEGLYDDWVLDERERLRELYLQALANLVQVEKAAGRLAGALDCALRLVQAEPLAEETQREVMRLYVALNRPEAALKQFEACRALLATELGVEPEPETLALAQEIASHGLPREGPPEPAYLPPALPIQESPLVSERAVQLPLVGRRVEREQLVARLEAVFHGTGGVFLVEGEAGVGKTRLVQEVARDAQWRGAQVLWGRFQQGGGAAAFEPLVDALQGGLSPVRLEQLSQLVEPIWLSVMQPLLPGLDESFSLQVPPLSDPTRERERLGQAFGELMSAWGQATPLVLILEDLHWADLDTLALLGILAARIRTASVFLLCTQRGEEARAQPALWAEVQKLLHSSAHPPLQLERLGGGSCGELVRRWLGLSDPAPRFEARLYQETEGNPLFVLETLRTLYDEGLLAQGASGEWQTPWDESTQDYHEMPLSPVVESVIARRLQGLADEQRALLGAAAVLGDEFEFSLLSAAAGLQAQALLPLLSDLLHKHFLFELPAAYRFSHDKVRQVVYQALAQDERQRLHQRCGEALQGSHPERLAQLAWHFFQGRVWDQAADYSQKAGDRAVGFHAHGEAAAHYTQALHALGRLGGPADASQLFALHLAREQARAMLGERDAQAEDLTVLEELLHDPRVGTAENRLQVSELWAVYWDAVSDYPKALAAVQRFLQQAQEVHDDATAYRAHLLWGRMLRVQGETEAAREHIEQAHLLAQRTGDLSAQADSLCNLGVICSETGDYGPAGSYYQRALEVADRSGDQVIRAYIEGRLANLAHYLADSQDSIEHHQKALATWRAHGDRRRECMELYNLSLVLNQTGDHLGARRTLQQVCELAHAIGDRRVEGYAWVFLGLVLEYLDDYQAARLAYEEGLRLRREVGLRPLEMDALAGLARVATAQGDHKLAVEYANRVLDWLEGHGYEGVGDPLLAYCGAYRALLAAGEEAGGRAALQNAYALLMQFADSIPDPEQRRAYLHDGESMFDIWGDYQRLFSRRITVSLPHVEAPTGRPLRPEEWVTVTWTLEAPEDQGIANKTERRCAQLLRLLAEAGAQNAAPTVDDLAQALEVSQATLKRDLARLRQAGHTVKTRGTS